MLRLHGYEIKDEQFCIDLYINNTKFKYFCNLYINNTFIFTNQNKYVEFANVYIDYETVNNKKGYDLTQTINYALDNNIQLNSCIQTYWYADILESIRHNPKRIIGYAKMCLTDMNERIFVDEFIKYILLCVADFTEQVKLSEETKKHINSVFVMKKLEGK